MPVGPFKTPRRTVSLLLFFEHDDKNKKQIIDIYNNFFIQSNGS